jgi:hypothetical protein
MKSYVVDWAIIGEYYVEAPSEADAQRMFVNALMSGELKWSEGKLISSKPRTFQEI